MFVYGTYVKFPLDDIWNLFQGDTLPNNASNFCRQMINCMRAWNYLQKTSDLPLNTDIIKQTHRIMIEDEKDVLVGEYTKSPVFAEYPTFTPASHIERYMKDAIFRFYGTKKDYPIMVAANFFGNIINIIHLEMETEEFVV